MPYWGKHRTSYRFIDGKLVEIPTASAIRRATTPITPTPPLIEGSLDNHLADNANNFNRIQDRNQSDYADICTAVHNAAGVLSDDSFANFQRQSAEGRLSYRQLINDFGSRGTMEHSEHPGYLDDRD